MFVSEILRKLKDFCTKNGYTSIPNFDVIKGAGTFNPTMIENIIKDKPFKFMSEEWSYRINDSTNLIKEKYCMRLSRHLQLQILEYPGTNQEDTIKFFFCLLKEIGILDTEYFIEIKKNNWTHETLGALGKGYEALVCGLEVAQITEFEYMCGKKILGGQEIAIGVERLASIIQNVNSIFDLKWDENFSYRDLFYSYELESLQEKNLLTEDKVKEEFNTKKKEVKELIKNKMYNRAFREFALLNHILGKLEICSKEFQRDKRLIIEELKIISKEIWKNI